MSDAKTVKRKKTGGGKSEENTTPKEEAAPKFRYGPMPSFSNQRFWSRLVVFFGMIVFAWYSSGGPRETIMAKYNTDIRKTGQQFDCSKAYLEEIKKFPKCVPERCGRWVTDRLVTHNEADALLNLAKKGIALGGSSGGATILDLHSGALSFGTKFINIYSLEKKFATSQDLLIYKLVREKIQRAIAENFNVDYESLHLTHPTFFSKLTAGNPRIPNDEYWHIHVDKETYESFHYTSLVYLNDYSVDFKGGRFVFVNSPKPNRNITVEPRKGRVSMFTSGAENPHFVERVKEGVRYAITVSFTCDASKAIKDPEVR